MTVPLLDLTAQYKTIADDVRDAILDLVEQQRFILGPPVEALEKQIAEYLGVEHAVGCASGTDALLLSLRAADVEPGDEVVTTPFTFFATAGAIHNVGARPVFADIDPETYNLDVEAAAEAVTKRTCAIMPVHLFGQMAPMQPFRELADQREIALIEDAAQAIGAGQRLEDGRDITTGSLGDACAFSFFPSKNLGAFGDAGMVVTNDTDLATRLRSLRAHGGTRQYYHEEVGYNSRLDALQAVVLSAKLPHLEEWSEARRANAARYDEAFADLEGLTTPVVDPANRSIFNQYTIRIHDRKRDKLKHALDAQGIGSAIYYPLPLHLQPCFAYLGYDRGDFPVAEKAAEEVLSLPVFPELGQERQDRVIEAIRNFFGG